MRELLSIKLAICDCAMAKPAIIEPQNGEKHEINLNDIWRGWLMRGDRTFEVLHTSKGSAMNRFAMTAATALIVASPAFAQTATPAAPTAPAATSTAPADTETSATPAMASGATATGSEGGMTMGTTSTVALKFVEFASADVMASRLEDLDVYNNQNEEIGEIEDLVIKDGKSISGVVVSVGGFLGLGDRYVLLDPSSIVLAEQDGKMRALVNTSKDELTAAPEFKYEQD